MNMREVAKALNMPYTTYVNYEKGVREPNSETLIAMANYYNTSIDYLIGKTESFYFPADDNVIPMPEIKIIPLIGTIACGEPILAEENIEGYAEAPERIRADFALRCKGDSMINARIFDGDIVYIRQQAAVENGDIAAVLIGDEATLKRVRIYDDHIVLEPENPLFRPLSYWGEEMNTVRILGKAVAFTSVVR